ncbi:hypothetical protein [Candidatus Methylomirabilis sp.]
MPKVYETFIRSARRLHHVGYLFWIVIMSLTTAVECALVKPPVRGGQ